MRAESSVPIVTDDRPSIIYDVFPSKIFQKLSSLCFSISQTDLRRFLGKNFNYFNAMVNMITGSERVRAEFFLPVIPLSYYDLLLEKHPEDREALKIHGLSHAFRALKYPEYRYWWREKIDLIAEVLNGKRDLKGLHDRILKFGLTRYSLSPIEEMIATYLRDYQKASRGRRKWLEYFGRRELKSDDEWPYIVAYKSIYMLHGAGFDTKSIEKIIGLCDHQANLYEIGKIKNKGYLSSTPYLINIIKNLDKIKEGRSKMEKLKIIIEMLDNPAETKGFESLSYSEGPERYKLVVDGEALSSEKLWKAWKREKSHYFQMNGEASLSTLYRIADFIVISLIVVEYGKGYEIIIPKMIGTADRNPLVEVLVLIKLMLFELSCIMNESFWFNFREGDEIEEFGEKIVFPKIEVDDKYLREIPNKINWKLVEKINDKLAKFNTESKIFKEDISLQFLKDGLSMHDI